MLLVVAFILIASVLLLVVNEVFGMTALQINPGQPLYRTQKRFTGDVAKTLALAVSLIGFGGLIIALLWGVDRGR